MDECTTRSKAFALGAVKLKADAKRAANRPGFVSGWITIAFLDDGKSREQRLGAAMTMERGAGRIAIPCSGLTRTLCYLAARHIE
jgi:hypothetical protein